MYLARLSSSRARVLSRFVLSFSHFLCRTTPALVLLQSNLPTYLASNVNALMSSNAAHVYIIWFRISDFFQSVFVNRGSKAGRVPLFLLSHHSEWLEQVVAGPPNRRDAGVHKGDVAAGYSRRWVWGGIWHMGYGLRTQGEGEECLRVGCRCRLYF
jgi:hypothetical protein